LAHRALLEIEQELFAPQAAAVTAHLAALVDNTMTGNDDGDAVLAVGPANRPNRAGIANCLSQPLVRLGLSVRNLQESLPNQFLKRRSFHAYGNVELRELAVEIL